ncbi:unnamed protein product [Acanthoscelides obtectus]|nr:unnamed protein product [Acanthoscelides obtectus]CAK1664872.1 hypothetical protein AOBTE_LOCUS24517 [Acanthoscelides obtectus]
MFSYPGY